MTKTYLGDILIKEGCITSAQLDEALIIQKEERSYPLSKILINLHLIHPSDLQKASELLGEDEKIGDLLVKERCIGNKQLQEALKIQKKQKKLLGEILLELNFISREKLIKALIKQANKPKLGEWLVSQRLLSDANLKLALRFQSRGRRLGDILVELGHITRQKLKEIIEIYDKKESLESVLLNEKFITQNQLNEVKTDPSFGEEKLVRGLIAKGILDETHVLQAEAMRYEIPFQHFAHISFSEDDKKKLSSIVGAAFSKKHKIIPAFISGNTVTLATPEPNSLEQIDYISQLHKHLKFLPCFISYKDFERIYGLIFGKSASISRREASTIEVIYEHGTEEQIRQLENLKQPEAVRLVNLIIEKGMEMHATDIHIESDADGTKVRYRVDGVLRTIEDLDFNAAVNENILPIISRFKVISNMDLAERRLPQDGAFRLIYNDHQTGESFPVDFRISTIKGYGLPENAAIRILDPRRAGLLLEDLNYFPGDLAYIKRILNSPSGLFLLVGPTGCGKTTTLYACIHYLNDPRIKIMTCENPVEYVIPGTTQVNTNARIGLTYAQILRTFLRQDPDVVLVGEIRDEETAEIAIKAAETGHLILSTLHTSDTTTAILRLLDLGISAESLASTLLGIISQRLLKVNCPNCQKEYFPSEEEWQMFFTEFPVDRHFYKSAGCEHCDYLGVKGRKPAYEMLTVDRRIQALLRANTDMARIREEALKNGMLSLVEHSILQPKDFSLSEMFRTAPYNLIEEFKTSPIIAGRLKTDL